MHDHKTLHWNVDHRAECVICGHIYGKLFFPQLAGFFSPQQYDELEKEMSRFVELNRPVVASTFSLQPWKMDGDL